MAKLIAKHSGPELNVALQAFAGGFPFSFGLRALRPRVRLAVRTL